MRSHQLALLTLSDDDATLSSTGRDQLASDARCLQAQGTVEMSLVGATDPRGTEEYNLALGGRRVQQD